MKTKLQWWNNLMPASSSCCVSRVEETEWLRHGTGLVGFQGYWLWTQNKQGLWHCPHGF